MKKLEKYRAVLTAISYINQNKDSPWLAYFKDSFLEDKDLILNYIVSKECLPVRVVSINKVSDYFSTICNEIIILWMWFHFNVRKYNWEHDFPSIDKEHKNERIVIQFQYAFYLIEKFKISKKLY